jgi:CRISPR system Cascade subunit CasB
MDTSNSPVSVEAPDRAGARLQAAVNRIAAGLRHAGAAGDRASLKRLQWNDPSSPAYWRFLTEYVEEAGLLTASGDRRHDEEVCWAAILASVAQLAELHRPGRALGEALAAADFAELRFVRLLRAREHGLLDNVRLTARYLAAKGEYVDCTDLAWLVLSAGGRSEEKVRRRIAQAFYSSKNNKQATQEDS